MKRMLVAAATGAALAVLAAPAGAATKHGITPVSPKATATVPVGQPLTFKARVKGPGTVWFLVCNKKKKDKEGRLCHDQDMGPGKRAGKGVYTYTPQVWTFPEYFLQAPGTYYWQVFRIDCGASVGDCIQEGPVARVKVG